MAAFLLSCNMLSDVRYQQAYTEIVSMLEDEQPLSIKRAVYISEWAYLHGELDSVPFNKEISRISCFINRFAESNGLTQYKTGKQMAICEYFFKPWSGNNHTPYIYDFGDDYPDDDWHYMLVSRVLETHKGRCRSLPWAMMVIAEELDAEMYLAYAPRHVYIMYSNLDNHYPEEWVNIEVTSHQFVPAFWIKEHFEIPDSAIHVGTYMQPLTKKQIVARQLSDLAFSYWQRNGIYDEFTYLCADVSLRYYPMNPNAIIIKQNSAREKLLRHLKDNNYQRDSIADRLNKIVMECDGALAKTCFIVPCDGKYSNY